MEKRYFPIFIDLSNRQVLVVGGGKIALRRVETLLDFVGQLRVVSPEITEELCVLWKEGRILWEKELYHAEVLEGADLVLAATDDPTCNEQIVADCRQMRIPVNASHKKECCDFYFPGIIEKGSFVIGVTSSGQDHVKTRQVRKKIGQALEEMEGIEREKNTSGCGCRK